MIPVAFAFCSTSLWKERREEEEETTGEEQGQENIKYFSVDVTDDIREGHDINDGLFQRPGGVAEISRLHFVIRAGRGKECLAFNCYVLDNRHRVGRAALALP